MADIFPTTIVHTFPNGTGYESDQSYPAWDDCGNFVIMTSDGRMEWESPGAQAGVTNRAFCSFPDGSVDTCHVIGGMLCQATLIRNKWTVSLVDRHGHEATRAVLSPPLPSVAEASWDLAPVDPHASSWFEAGLCFRTWWDVFESQRCELHYTLESSGSVTVARLTSWTVTTTAPESSATPKCVSELQKLVAAGVPGRVLHQFKKRGIKWWYPLAAACIPGCRFGREFCCTTPEDVASALDEAETYDYCRIEQSGMHTIQCTDCMITDAATLTFNDGLYLLCTSDDFCAGNALWAAVALPSECKVYRLRGRRLSIETAEHTLLLAVPNCSRLRWAWICAVVVCSSAHVVA